MDKSVFDVMWPEACRATRAVLRKRGLTNDDVSDVLQLTAERALRSSTSFGSQEHFTHWCLRTSRHVSIDEWRRTRLELVGDVPERRTADVADRVIARLDLAAVERQIALLPQRQRDAILNFETVTGDRQATFRLSSAKREARKKLRRVIEGTAAAFTGRFGRWGQKLREFSHSPAATATTAGIAIALAIGGAVAQGELKPHPQPARQDTTPRAHSAAVPEPPKRLTGGAPPSIPGVVATLPAPTHNGSKLPSFTIPLGHNADGSPSSIHGGEVDGPDRPLACVSRTPATPRVCVDPDLPKIDNMLGLELI